MACLGQTAAITASSPYPHYSGFYGYIQPYNDGRTSKILRTDGTLHEANQQGVLASEECDYIGAPPPSKIQDYRLSGAQMRWCPSDNYNPLLLRGAPNEGPAGYHLWTPSNY